MRPIKYEYTYEYELSCSGFTDPAHSGWNWSVPYVARELQHTIGNAVYVRGRAFNNPICNRAAFLAYR